MPDPRPRIDREYAEKVEFRLEEAMLYKIAEFINAYTKAGAIYGQVMLPPEEAAAKRAAMGGQ